MTTLFDADLSAREFGGAKLHVSTFFIWLKEKGLHLNSIPLLSNHEFVQVEALLCCIGGAAVADLTLEQASKIVANDKALRASFVGRGTSDETRAMLAEKLARFDAGEEEILIGANPAISGSAHQKWRDLISRAVDDGELVLLDHASSLPIQGLTKTIAASEATPNAAPDKSESSEKPWVARNPGDPEPEQSWYTPARYFARKLVLEDSTLLLKRDQLAGKVSDSMFAVGIKKRGGKKKLDPATVKKAFSNVTLA